MKEVTAKIYPFNTQSRHMFEAVGFKSVSEDRFACPTACG